VMMALPLGSIIGSVAVLWRGRIGRKGLAFLGSLVCVSLCVLGIAMHPPLWLFACLTCVWGIGHSIFFNTSRTLFQEAAPESHRARVLAIHPLAFLGMSPFSTMGAGLLGEGIGLLETFAVGGGMMMVVTVVAWVASPVRGMR
jgi:MFS family permease